MTKHQKIRTAIILISTLFLSGCLFPSADDVRSSPGISRTFQSNEPFLDVLNRETGMFRACLKSGPPVITTVVSGNVFIPVNSGGQTYKIESNIEKKTASIQYGWSHGDGMTAVFFLVDLIGNESGTLVNAYSRTSYNLWAKYPDKLIKWSQGDRTCSVD